MPNKLEFPVAIAELEPGTADIFEIAKNGARTVFERFGEVRAVALILGHTNGHDILFKLDGEFTGDTYDAVCDVKEAFAQFIGHVAVTTKASQLAFVSEIWFASPEQAEGHDSIEKAQGRKEGIYITFEKAGLQPTGLIAEIKTAENGMRTLGAWDNLSSNIQGRFVHLLRQPAKGDA